MSRATRPGGLCGHQALREQQQGQGFELSPKCLTPSSIQLLSKAGFLSAWKCPEEPEQPELSCLVFAEGIQLPQGWSWAACRLCSLLAGVNILPAPSTTHSSPSKGRVSDPKFLSEIPPALAQHIPLFSGSRWAPLLVGCVPIKLSQARLGLPGAAGPHFRARNGLAPRRNQVLFVQLKGEGKIRP